MTSAARQLTFGVIVGNRDFFPDQLCVEGRKLMLKVLEEEGFRAICLDESATKCGAIENYDEAKKCAELFRKHADEIDGVIVTLPNFGDEKAVANALRMSGLNVPVLVHAFPDAIGSFTVSQRRDSFCGKISVCNNLRQYSIPFTLTDKHTVDPASEEFRRDLHRFAAICRIVRGLRGLRIGSIGARPAAFNTVRFSEKLLEAHGISVEPVDLSEILGRAERLGADDPRVVAKLERIKEYVDTSRVPAEPIVKMAKFGVVVDEWMDANELQSSAVQCWSALEEYFGIVPCTLMSMMSNRLMPSACEVDVMGALSMYVLQQASLRPSALVDWNNNYGDDPNKAVIFHCSNLPKDVFESAHMDYPPILASTLGKENTYGVLAGRVKQGVFTYGRVSTDDAAGTVRAYVGEGRLTDDPLDTFGGYGVVEIPRFQSLLNYICANGFEHHVAINLSATSRAVEEALKTYLGWDVYRHDAEL